MDQETVGDIFRAALLVLGVWSVASGVFPFFAGITGQGAYAAESTTVIKDVGVTTAAWDTEMAPSHSWIKVHLTSNLEATVTIVALNSRVIRVQNASGFASADDTTALVKGTGTDVTVTAGHGGPVAYRIAVHIGPNARLAGQTDQNLSYTLTWEVQKMDPMVIVGGIGLFSMFFVTEYLLHMRKDIRALSRKIEKLVADGGVRAPIAALGAPVAVAAEEISISEEAPAARAGGFFGKRAAPARPAAEPADEIPMPPPTPAVSAPPPSSRYAASAPAAEPLGPPPYAPPPAYSPPPAYAAPAPAPAYQAPAPARQAAPMEPVAPPPAAPGAGEPEPVSKVRCPQCKHIVPVFTMERPTPIRCPNCGKRGMLTK